MTSGPRSDSSSQDRQHSAPVLATRRQLGPDASLSGRWQRLTQWSPTSAPVALLLGAGMMLGPRGVNLLTTDVLSLLDIAVPVALGTLGVLVGLSVGDHRGDDRREFVAASLGSVLCMLTVSSGLAIVTASAGGAVGNSAPMLIWAGGICAASSLTLPTGNALEPRTGVTKVIELGVLLPIVVGGLGLAGLRAGSIAGSLVLVGQGAGITLALAASAALLLSQVPSDTEGRVGTAAALLLVGGAANALSQSALFGGLLAGVFWRYTGRRAQATITRDVLFAQHPLVVLVLLVAGARADLSTASLALGAAFVAARALGQLAGGLLVRRVAHLPLPRDLGVHLLSPGVFGVAFALQAARAVGDDASILLTAVVVGTAISEVLALLLQDRRNRA